MKTVLLISDLADNNLFPNWKIKSNKAHLSNTAPLHPSVHRKRWQDANFSVNHTPALPNPNQQKNNYCSMSTKNQHRRTKTVFPVTNYKLASYGNLIPDDTLDLKYIFAVN